MTEMEKRKALRTVHMDRLHELDLIWATADINAGSVRSDSSGLCRQVSRRIHVLGLTIWFNRLIVDDSGR